ncbi:hypothetical protein SAMN05216554_0537 [Herbiconiux ginsengi]|uniref:Uncharacterized protein n=1 Tax=Herbiconiux ginsengi TaxID=381665 RepID=A0A1H3KEV3_9MICO|nr:hypothetical protein SAMN05216554_0537 [Herbiconiux ginsengi]
MTARIDSAIAAVNWNDERWAAGKEETPAM